MLNFEYYTPTKVVFGKDTEKQAGELVKAFGGTKVLVHFGGQSAKKSGLLDRICNSLEEAGLSYVTLGGVVPNPHLSKVYEGILIIYICSFSWNCSNFIFNISYTIIISFGSARRPFL